MQWVVVQEGFGVNNLKGREVCINAAGDNGFSVYNVVVEIIIAVEKVGESIYKATCD
jgi:hypothetical protein